MANQPISNRKGGPQTAAGKVVAARNSTKIGVYARQLILPGENPEEFEELESLFVADFQPSGVTEAALVHELAVLVWKKRRLEGVEHRQLMQHLQSAPAEYEFAQAGMPIVKGMEAFFFDPYQVDECDVSVFREYYLQMKLLRFGALDEATLGALQTNYPQSFSRLAAEMQEIGLKSPTPASMVSDKYKDQLPTEKNTPLSDAINRVYEEALKIVWAADNKQALVKLHERIRDKRLATRIDNEPYDRAYEHLARNFYKTLSELRKQQDWRRKQQVIDVTKRTNSHLGGSAAAKG